MMTTIQNLDSFITWSNGKANGSMSFCIFLARVQFLPGADGVSLFSFLPFFSSFLLSRRLTCAAGAPLGL